MYIPTISKKELGATDIFSKLLEQRTIMLTTDVNEQSATIIQAQLMLLDQMKTKKGDMHEDIYFYINSPGGSVHAGLAIYDTMKLLKSDVVTICTGYAASMGMFLLSGGTKGKRYATENSHIMMHQVSSGTRGHIEDQKRSLQHSEQLNKLLMRLIADHTGKTSTKVKKDADRDRWFTAKEALEYGIIDHIAKAGTGLRIEE